MATQISSDMIPQELAHLPSEVRLKAVDMANQLMESGMELRAALSIAQARGDTWLDGEEGKVTYHLIPHADGWQLVQSGSDEPGDIESTKQKLLDSARTRARKESTRLVVHAQDGEVQTVHDYRE